MFFGTSVLEWGWLCSPPPALPQHDSQTLGNGALGVLRLSCQAVWLLVSSRGLCGRSDAVRPLRASAWEVHVGPEPMPLILRDSRGQTICGFMHPTVF